MPNLFTFRGRLSRLAFWRIKILVVLINMVGHLAVFPLLSHGVPPHREQWQAIGPGPLVFLILLTVLVCWIALAAGVRRWHDRDHSGWWMLILLVPVVGAVWYLVECGFRAGTPGPNTFGPDPLVGASDRARPAAV